MKCQRVAKISTEIFSETAEFDIDHSHVRSAQVEDDFDLNLVAVNHDHEADLHAVADAAAVVVVAVEMVDKRSVELFTTSRPTENTAHPKRPNGRLKLITYHHAAVGKI